MLSAILRLILLRLVPGRLLPILTVVEAVRLVRQVRRRLRNARQRRSSAAGGGTIRPRAP